jgi:thioesterase domain-containing protein/acyl carrier protein
MSTLEPKPTAAMIDVLTPIWQRVLQLPSIGVEDNFFDLGGESSSALELFNAIAQTCGRELPPVMIYQAPTIAALASLLEEPRTSRFPARVLLKSGAESPPVFITHGLGGTVIDFYQVVRHIQTAHPIHGMQARGIDGVEAPFDRIEDMAQYYLDAVKELQPHGPYLLIGYSLGGLVTLEMAQRLRASGEKVALLALLDAYPHIRNLPPGQRTQLALQRMRRHASNLLKLPVREAISQIGRPSERQPLISAAPYQPPAGVSLTPAMQHVRNCAYRALKRYRHRYYGGKIRFVKAEIITDFPRDPVAVWTEYAGKLEVDSVPGDHLGIMTTHAQELASVLTRYIREATGEERSRP